MRHTYTRLLYHVVFATKHRAPLFVQAIREPVFAYMRGVARELRSWLLAAEGVDDHAHVLVEAPPTVPVSALLQRLKGSSSHWINERRLTERWFAWQGGYSAFTISHSAVDRVRNYIERQAEHHARIPFEVELARLLELQGLPAPVHET